MKNILYFPREKFLNNVSIKYNGIEAKFPIISEDENRLYLEYFMNCPISYFKYPESVQRWIYKH